MTSPDRRLNADQIKSHPFFYGVDWDAIRRIDAPFIPNLRSITDTSYFPTDEIDQNPAEAPTATPGGAQKDLAFLGCVDNFLRSDLAEITAQIYIQEVYYFFSCLLNHRPLGVCGETRSVVQYRRSAMTECVGSVACRNKDRISSIQLSSVYELHVTVT